MHNSDIENSKFRFVSKCLTVKNGYLVHLNSSQLFYKILRVFTFFDKKSHKLDTYVHSQWKLPNLIR